MDKQHLKDIVIRYDDFIAKTKCQFNEKHNPEVGIVVPRSDLEVMIQLIRKELTKQ